MILLCSDIHGLYDRYIQAVNLLKDNDQIIILGDVIDRGPDGIKILLDIMGRDNVTLMRGNHEEWMLEMFDEKNGYSLDYIENSRWCDEGNGGLPTYEAFLSLDEYARKDLISFLHKCPIMMRIEHGESRYILAHGCCANPSYLEQLEVVHEQDMSSDELEQTLWESPLTNLSVEHRYQSGYIYIHGHIPVQIYHGCDDFEAVRENDRGYQLLFIDGGCGTYRKAYWGDHQQHMNTALIVYRLEKNDFIYIR